MLRASQRGPMVILFRELENYEYSTGRVSDLRASDFHATSMFVSPIFKSPSLGARTWKSHGIGTCTMSLCYLPLLPLSQFLAQPTPFPQTTRVEYSTRLRSN